MLVEIKEYDGDEREGEAVRMSRKKIRRKGI
jgi:hypothetical protein